MVSRGSVRPAVVVWGRAERSRKFMVKMGTVLPTAQRRSTCVQQTVAEQVIKGAVKRAWKSKALLEAEAA